MKWIPRAFALLFVPFATASFASCGWSHVDPMWSYDASGPWNPKAYRSLVDLLTVANLAGDVWEGSDSRLGRTLWQATDSMLITTAAEEVGKHVFTRARPNEGGDPCLWFQGGSHYSFPSGEAAFAAGLVTPYVLEYGRDNPMAYSLLALPLYVGIGRLKNQAHWQTDVIAGWAIGGLSGWYSHGRETPWTVQVLPRGLTVGYRRSF
jgi:undecaprenyl-diphosphatase